MKPDWDDRKPRDDDWKIRAEFAALLALTLFAIGAGVLVLVRG